MNEGVTITEAARALGVSEWAVRRRIKSGKLKAALVGREWRVDLEGCQPLVEESLADSEFALAHSNTAIEALADALAEERQRASEERQRVADLERERAELFGRLGFYQA